jgi:hypothetical protein
MSASPASSMSGASTALIAAIRKNGCLVLSIRFYLLSISFSFNLFPLVLIFKQFDFNRLRLKRPDAQAGKPRAAPCLFIDSGVEGID